jgi:two-component system cell cycle sensor histidine kinase/response regulator CckA
MTISATHTILLVEDEVPVRRLIARILDLQEYRILEAGHGEEALSVSESYAEDIHLLVTDIMMPIMNGQELAARLSALRPRMAVLFISGYPGKHIPDNLIEKARVDYLPKPFRMDALQEKVKNLLR